jgi:hypothetical protein
MCAQADPDTHVNKNIFKFITFSFQLFTIYYYIGFQSFRIVVM